MGVLSRVCPLLTPLLPLQDEHLSQDSFIFTNSLSPDRLIPILVNGMKYSEIDIILLKVSQGYPQLAMGGQDPMGLGCWVGVSHQC